MNSKKIVVVLLTIGVIVTACAIFSRINIKGTFTDSIKQNTVYTKEDTSAANKEDFYVSGAEEEAYKEKCSEILKKYFNISIDNNEKLHFEALRFNEKTLDEMNAKSMKELKDLYDNKKISKEEYDKEVKRHDGGSDDIDAFIRNLVEKSKHGMISSTFEDENRNYLIIINENTKEADSVRVNEDHHTKSDASLTLSEEQIKNTAEDFIKQNKLGDIENPKCILVKEEDVFYQDGNDQSKKVKVGIDKYTGKVISFSVNEYANLEYDEEINENK